MVNCISRQLGGQGGCLAAAGRLRAGATATACACASGVPRVPAWVRAGPAPASAGPSWALGARPQPASPDLNSGGKVSFSVAQRSAPPGPRAGFPGARRGPSGTFPGPDRFRARSRGPNSAASRPPPRGARQAVLAAGEISGRRRECWFWISPDGSR